jgi:hypothetical protein
MTTKAKKRRVDEHDEAEHIERAIVSLGASDFRPGVRRYAVAPADHLDATRVLKAAAVRTNGSRLDESLGAFMNTLNNLPGQAVSECRWATPVELAQLVSSRVIPPLYKGSVVRLRYAWIKPDGRCATSVALLGSEPTKASSKHGGTGGMFAWYSLTAASRLMTGSNDPRHAVDVNFVVGTVASVFWNVRFAVGDSPAAQVPTTGFGVAGLFALRDKPAGLTRRKALLHWVRDHHRRKSDGTVGPVAAHFRGAEWFDWFDMRCQIVPPEVIGRDDTGGV